MSLEPALKGPVEVVPCSRADLDVAALHDCAKVIGEAAPQVVLNCAGRTDLMGCESSAWDAFRVNRDGADHVARACSKIGALPVYFSTDLVFDGGKLQPYREEDAPNPLNAYGETKLAGELRTASAARRHLIVRSGWIYGQPGRHFLSEPFVVGDQQIGQATWVEDFMDAVLFLIRNGKAGRWHVASPGAVTQAGVARRVRERSNKSPSAKLKNDFVMLPGSSVLDVGKLEKAGHPMRPWDEALEDWLKSRKTEEKSAGPTRRRRASR